MLPYRYLGEFRAVFVPPTLGAERTLLDSDRRAADEPTVNLVAIAPANIITEHVLGDPQFVVMIQKWPRTPHSFMIVSRDWQPQRIAESTARLLITLARGGDVCIVFNRRRKLTNHFHAHVHLNASHYFPWMRGVPRPSVGNPANDAGARFQEMVVEAGDLAATCMQFDEQDIAYTCVIRPCGMTSSGVRVCFTLWSLSPPPSIETRCTVKATYEAVVSTAEALESLSMADIHTAIGRQSLSDEETHRLRHLLSVHTGG